MALACAQDKCITVGQNHNAERFARRTAFLVPIPGSRNLGVQMKLSRKASLPAMPCHSSVALQQSIHIQTVPYSIWDVRLDFFHMLEAIINLAQQIQLQDPTQQT